MDTGASRHFINQRLANSLKLEIKEDQPITAMFANNQKVTCNTSTTLKLGRHSLITGRYVKLYIMGNSPDKIILGNEFLIADEVLLD